MGVCAKIEGFGRVFLFIQETESQIYEIDIRVLQSLDHLVEPRLPALCLADIIGHIQDKLYARLAQRQGGSEFCFSSTLHRYR
jgi:hypothetical protein